MNVSDNIITSLDNGLATALVLLDFSKAFDTLDHSLLCAKLNFYGFDPVSVNFFESYLIGRQQKVILDESFSRIAHVTSGVPQGSVLGPILFLIYTSDIFDKVEYSNINAFADDTQISFPFSPKEVERACANINHDLSSIAEYSMSHNLKLNPDKCNALLFCSKRLELSIKSHIQLQINGKAIHITNVARNLGVIFDCRLRFQEHVSLLIKKCYLALRLLYTNEKIINFSLRKKLAESLVLPILNYCIIMYFPCLDKTTQYRLQKIQNSCCRFVFGLRKYDRVSAKIKELGWLTIENAFKYHLAVFVHRLLYTSSPPYLREKLSFRHNVHQLETRYNYKLSVPRFHSTIFTRSFTYCATKLYNSLNDDLKNIPVNSFRKKVRTFFC